MIFLIQDLFEFSNNIMNCWQHAFDQKYIANNNLNLYIILIDVINTKRFKDFDSKKIFKALLKFKVFVKDLNINTLDTIR